MEAKHVLGKQSIANCNNQNVEVIMMEHQNRRNGIESLVCGGAKHLPGADQLYDASFLRVLEDDPLPRQLIELASRGITYVGEKPDVLGLDEVVVLPKDEIKSEHGFLGSADSPRLCFLIVLVLLLWSKVAGFTPCSSTISPPAW